VKFSSRFIKDRSLPDKAIDLLDDAGAYLKTKHTGSIPPEIVEAGKKLASTVRTIENAIANHKVEIVRLHSDEERKQREELNRLQEQFRIRIGDAGLVTAEHVEEALSRWTGISLEAIRAGQNEDRAGKRKMETPAAGKKSRKRPS